MANFKGCRPNTRNPFNKHNTTQRQSDLRQIFLHRNPSSSADLKVYYTRSDHNSRHSKVTALQRKQYFDVLPKTIYYQLAKIWDSPEAIRGVSGAFIDHDTEGRSLHQTFVRRSMGYEAEIEPLAEMCDVVDHERRLE